ncbi:hypothetical protein PIB30_091144 [Stylosanthes scabra]|uniref:Uncharacterized protein n=1 Tax=Stylosanthes scabra TaxID=79078 RepID=A0ABU6YVV7_9FABA|nr:hypothetical protein [Stylosanthes scabra]
MPILNGYGYIFLTKDSAFEEGTLAAEPVLYSLLFLSPTHCSPSSRRRLIFTSCSLCRQPIIATSAHLFSSLSSRHCCCGWVFSRASSFRGGVQSSEALAKAQQLLLDQNERAYLLNHVNSTKEELRAKRKKQFKKDTASKIKSLVEQGGLTPRHQAPRLGMNHSVKGAGLLHFWVLPRLNLDSGCWRKLGHA